MNNWKTEITKIEEMYERSKSKKLLPHGIPDAFEWAKLMKLEVEEIEGGK